MAERAVRLATEGRVETLDGTELELEASSICVHGDAPNAPEIATAIRRGLEAAGVTLAPLAAMAAVAAEDGGRPVVGTRRACGHRRDRRLSTGLVGAGSAHSTFGPSCRARTRVAPGHPGNRT